VPRGRRSLWLTGTRSWWWISSVLPAEQLMPAQERRSMLDTECRSREWTANLMHVRDVRSWSAVHIIPAIHCRFRGSPRVHLMSFPLGLWSAICFFQDFAGENLNDFWDSVESATRSFGSMLFFCKFLSMICPMLLREMRIHELYCIVLSAKGLSLLMSFFSLNALFPFSFSFLVHFFSLYSYCYLVRFLLPQFL